MHKVSFSDGKNFVLVDKKKKAKKTFISLNALKQHDVIQHGEKSVLTIKLCHLVSLYPTLGLCLGRASCTVIRLGSLKRWHTVYRVSQKIRHFCLTQLPSAITQEGFVRFTKFHVHCVSVLLIMRIHI